MASKMINAFVGEHAFLSNFFPVDIFREEGTPVMIFPSVENAYQASKTTDYKVRLAFVSITAGQAKRLGRTLALREDWYAVRLRIMEELVRQKFTASANRPLTQRLLATGDAALVEGNWWGDTFWGVCEGRGSNHLGRILMQIRDELATTDTWESLGRGIVEIEPDQSGA